MKTRSTTDWRTSRRVFRDGSVPLLDVRSPSEFANGSIPGALNLPLLDDGERARVGTTYEHDSADAALQLGIQLFAEKAQRFRDIGAAMLGARRRVGVHCARGGMRSGFTATWLAAQGYEPTLLVGGYKTYRHDVIAALDELAQRPLLVLDGRTGVGKSDLLQTFPPGFPLLDFEALAHHRGSAFGDFAQDHPVPTQQNFENQLADAFLDLPEAGEILVEIENMIGPIMLPFKLRNRIDEADVVLLTRDFDDRVTRLAAAYTKGWTEATDELFVQRLALLKRHVAKTDLEALVVAVKRRDFTTAVALLLTTRYDKVYDKGIARRKGRVVAEFDLTRDEAGARAWIQARVTGRSARPARASTP